MRTIIYCASIEEITQKLDVVMNRFDARRLGLVTDLLPLIANLSVVENIMLPLSYHTGKRRGEAEAIIQKELDAWNIGHTTHYRQNQLSEVERFVVKYIQATILKPEAVMFVAPHRMIHADLQGIFCPMVRNLHYDEVTVMEHENFQHMYDGNLHFEERAFDQWLTHVLKTSN